MSGHSSKSVDQPFTGWWVSYSSVDDSTGVVSYLPWVQVSNEGWSDLSKTAFVDANGDELIDVVRADGSDWKVNYNGYGQSPTNGYVFTDPDTLRGANYTLAGDYLVFGQFDGDAANLMDAQFWRNGTWYTTNGEFDDDTDGVPGISLAGDAHPSRLSSRRRPAATPIKHTKPNGCSHPMWGRWFETWI